jgi:hypothetical protein
MARENGPGQREPDTPLERASVWLARAEGEHRSNWLNPALGCALVMGLVFGVAARRRLVLVTVIVMAVTWALMVLTRNAGGAAHHVVLMWPFPFVLVGLGLDAAAQRVPKRSGAVLTVVMAALVIQSVLTTNHYLAAFVKNGSSVLWSDAVLNLSDGLGVGERKEIEVMDWGFLNSLRLLHKGRLPLNNVGDWLMNPTLNSDELFKLTKMIESKNSLFVRHTPGSETFPGINEHLIRIAAEAGFVEKREGVVRDSNGRPIFELLSFERLPAQAQ